MLLWNPVAFDTIGPCVLIVQNRQERLHTTLLDFTANLSLTDTHGQYSHQDSMLNWDLAHVVAVFLNTCVLRASSNRVCLQYIPLSRVWPLCTSRH
jgi:hypothetical protein